MKILNNKEHRIFLFAMGRERKVYESEEFYDSDGTNELLDICDSIVRKINDAVPTRHGHWEQKYTGSRRVFFCSVCGDWTGYGETDYCPFCGADMREETESHGD